MLLDQILKDGKEMEDTYFRGNETELNQVAINGVSIVPTVKVKETTADSRTYAMHVEKLKTISIWIWMSKSA